MHFRCCTYLLSIFLSLPRYLLYYMWTMHCTELLTSFSYCLLSAPPQHLQLAAGNSGNNKPPSYQEWRKGHVPQLSPGSTAGGVSLISSLPSPPHSLRLCVAYPRRVLGLLLKWSKTISESCLYAALATRLTQLRGMCVLSRCWICAGNELKVILFCLCTYSHYKP